MKAAAIDKTGPPEVLTIHTLPIPKVGPKDVLISLLAAGVGIWDAQIRKGEYSVGSKKFPRVLGADGAGIVAFDKLTGKILWKATNDQPSYFFPSLRL